MSLQFPDDAPVANPLFFRSYSRRDGGERESLDHAIHRALSGLQTLGKLNDEQTELLRTHMEGLTALPAGRWLWVGGTPWLLGDANYSGAFNCTSTRVTDWRAFGLMMSLAMMGSGTGAVLEEECISQLPRICNHLHVAVTVPIGALGPDQRREGTETIQHNSGFFTIKVGDSRQGWTQAYEQLLWLASDSMLESTLDVAIDLGSIRPPGEPLRGFGGTANPVQLPELFIRVAAITNKAVGRRLTAIECCLLIDEAAKTVVAGNIRRSAGMRQFSESDIDAAEAKANLWTELPGGKWVIDPERDALRMANHTRVFHRKPTREEVRESVRKQYHSGEGAIQYAPEAIARGNTDILGTPWLKERFLKNYDRMGPEWARDLLSIMRFGDGESTRGDKAKHELDHRMARYGLNPCGEIIGADFHCNLAEVHLNRLNPGNQARVEQAFRAAGLMVASLLQRNFREERYRISRDLDPIVGVSFTGLFDYFVALFGVDWLRWWAEGRPPHAMGQEYARIEEEHLRSFRQAVESEIEAYCHEHGLRLPNRCTTVQPAGSKSLLTNASPGWHPPKAARYIRRVTFGKNDPVALACIDYGYTVVPSQSDKDENGHLLEDPFDPRCTEWLVEIPVKAPWADLPGADEIDISQFSALAQFDFYMAIQRVYTTHNTSATIEFREHEIEPLADAIHAAIDTDQGYISAALLARFDDKQTFPRLPFEPIDKETYERLHAQVLERRTNDDFHALLAHYDAITAAPQEAQGPAGCDSDACTLPLAGPQS
ncbi:MAG: ribonucleoside-triphosphate reductase, adenosylcobalamin-dependent [Cyanobium sp.]|nr:ribonucleoside-triphosphate reductase, adenosylcobalamin-dependent [Cyanobium sp.]